MYTESQQLFILCHHCTGGGLGVHVVCSYTQMECEHWPSNPPQNQSFPLRLQTVSSDSDLIRTLQYSDTASTQACSLHGIICCIRVSTGGGKRDTQKRSTHCSTVILVERQNVSLFRRPSGHSAAWLEGKEPFARAFAMPRHRPRKGCRNIANPGRPCSGTCFSTFCPAPHHRHVELQIQHTGRLLQE
jgi:hypothetical protein